MALILRKHWRPVVDGRVVRHTPGDRLDDDHPKRGWLLQHGIAVPDSEIPDPEPGPEAAPDGEPDEEPAIEEQEKGPKMPAKVAKLEAWQEYAKAQGVDPKGMKREEIIARFI